MKEEMDEITKIAYNCRQATFLIEKKQVEDLTAREKIELKIHLAGCYICRVYEQQSLLINNMVKNIFRSSETSEIKLDDEYKVKLKKRIEEKLNKN
jgi:hypothetical protein